jgi:hypothetical protein
VSVDSAGVEGDGASDLPSLSSDGAFVAFESDAANLVANDGNHVEDVFVHDRVAGTTIAASVSCTGALSDDESLNPAFAADGDLLAFSSYGTNLVAGDLNDAIDVFVFDRRVAGPDASWNNYGSGFPGTLGTPSITARGDPVLGTTVTVDVGNSLGSATAGLLFAGFSAASIPTNAGGTLLVGSFFLMLPLPIAAAGIALDADLPDDPALCGLSVFSQVLELDGGALRGLSFTPGLELALGR